MKDEVIFNTLNFKSEDAFEKYKAFLFEKVKAQEIIKVELKPLSVQIKDFFRLPDESTVWALVEPLDPAYTGYYGGFIEAEEVLEWKPRILRKVIFEEIKFTDEDEYLRFEKWLDEKVSEYKILEVLRASKNPVEKRFFQVKGETPIWALAYPSPLNVVSRWGYFKCLDEEIED